MRLCILDQNNRPASEMWDEFVHNHPEGGIFHLSAWQNVITTSLKQKTVYLYLWCNKSKAIKAILPLVLVNSLLFGRSLISVGFFVEGGVLANDEEAAACLLKHAQTLAKEKNVDFLEIRGSLSCAPDNSQEWQFKDKVYAGFIKDILPNEEDNLLAVPRKKRADIRKALQNSRLTFNPAADIRDFYACYAESVHHLGTPVQSLKFYRSIQHFLKEYCSIMTVKHGEQPICGLMNFTYKDKTMPYYGGATEAARALHGYDLLYWSVMDRARQQGLNRFDFGRSKYGTGAFNYKTFWGFTEKPLSYAFYLVNSKNIPDISPLNPSYQRKIALWKKLPLWLANRIGPTIARQIG